MKTVFTTFTLLLLAAAVACEAAPLQTNAVLDLSEPQQQQQHSSGLVFLTIGDWGHPGTHETQVAQQMGQFAERQGAAFVLALGDNFYERGVTSTTDSQWQHSFERVFVAQSLFVPWYALLGNHDHYGNTQAQIDYSQLSKRWNMPDYYYTKTFQVDSDTTLQVVFIDTVKISEGDSDQLDWIEKTLQESSAQYLIVAGHYPVYSGGEHGNTGSLVKHLLPLLKKYSVTAYLCGHDHNMQHLQEDGVDFFVSGAGAKDGTYSPIHQSKYGKVVNGFMVHRVDAQKMDVDMVDENGDIIYTTTSYPRTVATRTMGLPVTE